LNHGVTVTGGTEAGATNLLQGSSGPLQVTTQAPEIGKAQAFIGGIAQDIITGGAGGGDNIFGIGGNYQIHLGTHTASDTVWLNVIHEQSIIGPGTNFDQAITDVVGGVEIGVNFYLGALANISTVSGFSLGPTGDVLNIADSGWVHSGGGLAGGGTDFSLVVANGSAFVTPGASTVQLISTPG